VSVVLTGALALPRVESALDARLTDFHPIVTHPRIRSLAGDTNSFARVRGAGLAILREHVHRQVPSLLSGAKKTLASRVAAIGMPVAKVPWT
jgi:hypothetical protein